MLEAEIEKAVCDYARRKYDFLAEKFTSPNRRSVPDRLFSGQGNHHFFIEFKATGKGATELQERDHKRRRERGHRVYVCDNVEYGKHLIDREIVLHGPPTSSVHDAVVPGPWC